MPPQLPDQPIMKYVHPSDRRRPWSGVALGLVALVGMLAMSVLGKTSGTLDHLKQLNSAGVWLTTSLIETSAAILTLLLAAVFLTSQKSSCISGETSASPAARHSLSGQPREAWRTRESASSTPGSVGEVTESVSRTRLSKEASSGGRITVAGDDRRFEEEGLDG